MHTSQTCLALQIPFECIAFSDTMICKIILKLLEETHVRFVSPSNQSWCVVFPCRLAVNGTLRCWGGSHHEGLQLQMGLLPGLLGGGLQHLLLPAPGVVWEELPCAVRGSGKSHSGVGETNQLEEGGSSSHQPAPSSPCRCFTLFCTGPLYYRKNNFTYGLTKSLVFLYISIYCIYMILYIAISKIDR